MRVLLDANIFISYLLPTSEASPVRMIVKAALLEMYTLLLPDETTAEIFGKIRTKRWLAARVTQEEADDLLRLLRLVAKPIPRVIEEIPVVTRDPKDDYLLAYALIGQAEYLVTGDDDLLALGIVGTLKIVRPTEFAGLLGKS